MTASADGSVRSRIAAVLAERADALVARDAAAVLRLLHPQFTYTNASGVVLDAEGYLDLTVRGALRWRAQRIELGQLSHVGTTVVLTGVVEDHVARDGPGQHDHVWHFATTQVYVDDGGRLLYLAGHTGPLAGRGGPDGLDHPVSRWG